MFTNDIYSCPLCFFFLLLKPLKNYSLKIIFVVTVYSILSANKLECIYKKLFIFTLATVQMAEEHSDFVIGFICQSKLTADPKFLHMTPGK